MRRVFLKKIISLFFLFLSLLLIVSACGDDSDRAAVTDDEVVDENFNETEFPIVDEEITLKFFGGVHPASHQDWNEAMIYQEYQDLTNINIEWEMVPHSVLSERRNLALVNNDLPDAFHTAFMPNGDILKYGQQGKFIALNDLIEKYAPNLMRLFEESPEIKRAVTFPDGNIYSFPTIYSPEFLSLLLGSMPWIRQDILEEVGMDMPETTDEYYQFLTAVKEAYPDETIVPFGGNTIDSLLRWIRGSFGLNNKGQHNINFDLDPETGDLRYIPISPEYKEMIEYAHKLFSEELIVQNIYSMEHEQYLADGSEGRYASLVSLSPKELFSGDIGERYLPAPMLIGPRGDQIYSAVSTYVAVLGAFIITEANEHPEATVRWVDHFYGDDGARLFFMGVEGETYQVDSEGGYQYVDHIMNSPEGLSFEQELSKYLTWPGGGYPSIVTQEFFHGMENAPAAVEAAKDHEPHMIEETWPSFTHTETENEFLQSVGVDINTYVTENKDLFITGRRPMSEWDEYVETIENMGLDEYMEIMETTIERYYDNG